MFGDYIRKLRRFGLRLTILKELKRQNIFLDVALGEAATRVSGESDSNYKTYLDALKRGAILIAKTGTDPAKCLTYGDRISNLIKITGTPVRFFQYLEQISESAARFQRDYKDPAQAVLVALNNITDDATIVSEFQEYLKVYERYFRLAVLENDKTNYYSNRFHNLREESENIDDLCLGVDCLEAAKNTSTYQYAAKLVNFKLPGYCIRAAKKSGSLEEYKQKFTQAVNLEGDYSRLVKSYGAPVAALTDDASSVYGLVRAFEGRVQSLGDFPGIAVMELTSLVKDIKGVEAGLNSIENLARACQNIPLQRPRILGQEFPGIVKQADDMDQLEVYVDVYLKLWEKLQHNPDYRRHFSSGQLVSSFVDNKIVGIVPDAASVLTEHGDFKLSLDFISEPYPIPAGESGGHYVHSQVIDCITSVHIGIGPP